MLKKIIITILFTFIIFSMRAYPKETIEDKSNWSYLYKRNTLKVYKGKNAHNSYMAEGEIAENFFEVLAVAADIKKRSEWVPNLKSSKLVEGNLESKIILYEEFSLPWPAQNRDVVLQCLITKDYKKKTLLIQFKNITHEKVPLKKGVVRIHKTKGQMEFRFIDESTTYARYKIKLEAGGSLPKSIVSFFVKKTPVKALEELIKQIKKTKGQYTQFVEKHKKIAEES